MANNNKKVGKKVGIIAICVVAFATIIIFVIFSLLNQDGSNDVVIKGQTHYSGLICENKTLTHPVLTDSKPVTFKNTVSIVFSDDALSTITYQYDGTYESADAAKDAEALAAADYNIILANEYHEDIEIFSHIFRVDGKNLSLTITAQKEDISQKTAPYFLLDSTNSLPKSLDAFLKAYKNKGFSCKEK